MRGSPMGFSCPRTGPTMSVNAMQSTLKKLRHSIQPNGKVCTNYMGRDARHQNGSQGKGRVFEAGPGDSGQAQEIEQGSNCQSVK